MSKYSCDVVIIGGGIVGLCIANQILERKLSASIVIIDKEERLGSHSSGRNSGVLHAGIYYRPESLKAKVCVSGSRRLRTWIEDRKLPLNACGKVIVPQRIELDSQLDLLAKRGRANGAKVEVLDEIQLQELIPEARSSSGRALWSPNTVVCKPTAVIDQLQIELKKRGVRFLTSQKQWRSDPNIQQIKMNNNDLISYGHLFNCGGSQADRIAFPFGVGHGYSLLPFKGYYWQLKADCPIKPRCNLYPVPDLNVPFLGIHFTPNTDPDPVVSIGPTATPAWGRENYRFLEALEPGSSIKNLAILANQYLRNRGGFRKYVHEQAFLALPPLLLSAAQELIPAIEMNDLEISQKVGIRSQLFNQKTRQLEDDFLCLPGPASTHVMNAISPAFTASFALADLILDEAVTRIGC